MGDLSETPWREAALVAVDLETTGLDPSNDEIISFAAIPIDGGRVRLAGGVYRLARPRRMPGAETIRIHGLRPEDLADAPPITELVDELLGAIAERALVVHVAAVEKGFLQPLLREAGTELDNPIIDTAELAAELAALQGEPQPTRIGLTALAEQLALPVHRPHEADGDALTTAQAFLALATRLDSFAPQTVGSLAAVRRRAPGRWAAVRRALRGIGR